VISVDIPAVYAVTTPGFQCHGSPMGIDESFFDVDRRDREIVGSAAIVLNGVVIGWLYKTSDKASFVQVMPNAPLILQERFGIRNPEYDKGFVWNGGRVNRYSALTQIRTWPAEPNLEVEQCRP
jgi:hypothetical protein